MRYVIMGTAGHIDHGKSTLVKALTGMDPDRLKEEKERGITIDLGFADLVYPDGITIGIVDVPGHERLVKNMLAGAGGIDMVLMVIAADEGIMPQTREHLHICNLLRIKTGLIALTKADLAEPEWISLVSDEIRAVVKGTFLDGAEIVPVSSVSGLNMQLLKEKIKETALKTAQKPAKGLFRMPIDRVFTLKGFGTVATGTVVSGRAGVEQQIEILPLGTSAKIRGMHRHGSPVQEAWAGQRTAINLQGINKEDINRGDTLCEMGRFAATSSLDSHVELLDDAPALKSRDSVHFHIGTCETSARIILYEKDVLNPSEKSFCQFRLENPVVCQSGDRFIIRRLSPLQTIGGGLVLDPSPHRRRRKEGIDDLQTYLNQGLKEKIAYKIKRSSIRGMTSDSLEGWINAEVPEIKGRLSELLKEGVVTGFDGNFLHREAIGSIKESAISMLEEFHRGNPLKPGMQKEELRARLKVHQKIFTGILTGINEIISDKNLLRLKGFEAGAGEDIKINILKLLDEKKFQPPTVSEISEVLKMDTKKAYDVLKLMVSEGSAVKINDTIYISAGVLDDIVSLLRLHYQATQELAVSEFRDLLGTTRKYALPFLEYLDSHSITLRVGETRKLLLK